VVRTNSDTPRSSADASVGSANESQKSVSQRLRELKDLYEQKLLTKEQYDDAVAKVLNQ
jgi:hypothetical protein